MPTMVSLEKQSKALAKDTPIYIGKTQHWVRVKVLGDSEASQKSNTLEHNPGTPSQLSITEKPKPVHKNLHKKVYMVWMVEYSCYGILFSNLKGMVKWWDMA